MKALLRGCGLVVLGLTLTGCIAPLLMWVPAATGPGIGSAEPSPPPHVQAPALFPGVHD